MNEALTVDESEMVWDEEDAAYTLQVLEDLCASSHYFSIESLREEISKKVFDDIELQGVLFFFGHV